MFLGAKKRKKEFAVLFLKKKKGRKCVRVTVSVLFSSIYDGRGFESLLFLNRPKKDEKSS